MPKSLTIDYGIDLGTTNSCLAHATGMTTEIIKNEASQETTPSAVWLTKSGECYVGIDARERAESDDHADTATAFKRHMGDNYKYSFESSGITKTPEQLSAEVLKALKANLREQRMEDLTEVVITVPAAFLQPSMDATKRAAEMAGFTNVILLTEPSAAAMAYSAEEEVDDDILWLIFDFGGGTFDASLVTAKDGFFRIIDHGGDPHLGGEEIDKAILNELFMPALTQSNPLEDLKRANPNWPTIIGKLKLEAEKGKIRVSRRNSTQILLDNLYKTPEGTLADFNFELTRADVERLALRHIDKAINISKDVLEQNNVEAAQLDRVILVGGTTLMPSLRDRLGDKVHGLGAPLHVSIDPMTVVARGAAVFARSQKKKNPNGHPVSADEFNLNVEYSPAGPDVEFLIGGKVSCKNVADLTGYAIQFSNPESVPPWQGGRVELDSSGLFHTQCRAEEGRENTITIRLFDPAGNEQKILPCELPYRVAMQPPQACATMSIGVGLHGGEFMPYIPKGAPLPMETRAPVFTVEELKRGDADAVLEIPFCQGESGRADRNIIIGTMKMNAREFRNDVPVNSEVDILIRMDESQTITAVAYIPVLDADYEMVVEACIETPTSDNLEKELNQIERRLEISRQNIDDNVSAGAEIALKKIEDRGMIAESRQLLDQSRSDRDAQNKLWAQIQNIKQILDKAEDSLDVPRAIKEGREQIESCQGMLDEPTYTIEDNVRRRVRSMMDGIEEAIDTEDAGLIRLRVAETANLCGEIRRNQTSFWVSVFHTLCDRTNEMSDPSLAMQYVNQGREAMDDGLLEPLKSATLQLVQLLPKEEQIKTGLISGVHSGS